MSVAAQSFRVHRVQRGEGLGRQRAPVWAFVNMPMSTASSSAIRARGEWKV
jgi:nicotinate-nucleotide adenylyltransferase